MRRIHATAPNRIDLGGGTLDIPPLPHILPGSLTVNLAITMAQLGKRRCLSGVTYVDLFFIRCLASIWSPV